MTDTLRLWETGDDCALFDCDGGRKRSVGRREDDGAFESLGLCWCDVADVSPAGLRFVSSKESTALFLSSTEHKLSCLRVEMSCLSCSNVRFVSMSPSSESSS